MPLDKLLPFKNHPFRVVDDDSMQQIVDSIKQYGVIAPLIVRSIQDGDYEVISGHADFTPLKKQAVKRCRF